MLRPSIQDYTQLVRVATRLRRSRLAKEKRRITQIRDDVLWGCLWTGGLAAAAGLVVGLQYLVRGPEVLSGVRITFDQLILAYCVAALAGGIVLGYSGLSLEHRLVEHSWVSC